ncbi:MAG: YfhO family protein [Gammaproteobacteria bacterium]
MLDLAAVRFVVIPTRLRSRPDVADFVREAGLDPAVPLGPGLDLVENPHVLPRAYVTYRTRRAPPVRELLPLLAQQSFDPLAESFVEGDSGLDDAAKAPVRGAAAVIVRDDPQVVEVQATLVVPGLVVLADTFAQGWRATVDGQPAPILATNHLFRGVPAPAGNHVVRFEYRPGSLAIGATLSLAGALALALLGWRLKLRAAT